MVTFDMNSYLGKHVLSLVRNGDFAHAGEREAIELAMGGVPSGPIRSCSMRAVGVVARRTIPSSTAGLR